MKRKPSQEYSFTHTKQRLLERYNMDITKSEYQELCALVDKNQTKYGQPEVNGNDIQIIVPVLFKGKKVVAVWSCKEERVKTVLPLKKGI